MKPLTDYKEFVKSREWNEMELLYMCDTVCTGNDNLPFKIVPAANSVQNVLLVYEPEELSLILTPPMRVSMISWIECEYCNGEPYDAYLNCKMAIEKDD